MAFRDFSRELEALSDVWSTSPTTTDIWTPTGRSWPTDSRPIEVKNQNNIRGVAKPGAVRNDKILRAAHEKIVSDLAYVLGLPLPPVTLWDRGENFVDHRYCSVSAWAFPADAEWQIKRPALQPNQIELARRTAGAMRAFDTWVGASDRKDNHVLVRDDADTATLGLAYIDYAFALSREWAGVVARVQEPRAPFPSGVGYDPATCLETIQAIEKLEETRIIEIVTRIPSEYYLDGFRDIIAKELLARRGTVRTWCA